MRDAGDDRECAIEPLGETTLLLRFGERIDDVLNARVHAAAAALQAAALRGVTDLVPAYAALAIEYAPQAWAVGEGPAWRQLADAVRAVLIAPPAHVEHPAATIVIPVCYGGEQGPDLGALAAHCGLSENAVIARHAAGEYRVAMLGFAPGFAYLIGLDPTLQMPRRTNPRLRVARGSIGIGGAQTGIYPSELPGGWRLIGRTPLALFDPLHEPASAVAAGDRVRFRAIDAREFDALERQRR
jgi:KipI family sensor histidine kinase inhibitor